MFFDFINFIIAKIVFFCSSIGGDSFPKPLSPEDELKYLTAFREKGDQKAKEMLKSDYSSLSDVAYSLGYISLYDFSRDFKKHVGVSPSKY